MSAALELQADFCGPASFSSSPHPALGWSGSHLTCALSSTLALALPPALDGPAHSPDGEAGGTDVDGLHEATGLQLAQDLQG